MQNKQINTYIHIYIFIYMNQSKKIIKKSHTMPHSSEFIKTHITHLSNLIKISF